MCLRLLLRRSSVRLRGVTRRPWRRKSREKTLRGILGYVCLMTVGGGVRVNEKKKNNTSSTIIINLGTYLYTSLVYITTLCVCTRSSCRARLLPRLTIYIIWYNKTNGKAAVLRTFFFILSFTWTLHTRPSPTLITHILHTLYLYVYR